MAQRRLFHSTAQRNSQPLVVIRDDWLILGGKKICRVVDGHLEVKDTQVDRAARRQSDFCYIPFEDLIRALQEEAAR